jgi:hypothetical protein
LTERSDRLIETGCRWTVKRKTAGAAPLRMDRISGRQVV